MSALNPVSSEKANGALSPKDPLPSAHPFVVGVQPRLDTLIRPDADDTHIRDDDVHEHLDTHGEADGVSNHSGSVGHGCHDAQVGVADRSILIANIREFHKQNEDLMREEIALTLRVKAACRRACGGDIKEGAKLFTALENLLNDKEHEDHPLLPIMLGHAMRFKEARDVLAKHKRASERTLMKAAMKLEHIVLFVESVRGFGWISLGRIIGEAGDLSNYSNPGKLWKRMGMAPFKGKSCATWKKCGGLMAGEWEEAGYSPRRRAVMWNIGASLMKAQNPYRQVYLERKEYLRVREEAKGKKVLPADEITKDNADSSISKKHVDVMALHYMEKRLLRDLWRAWRGDPDDIAVEVEFAQ